MTFIVEGVELNDQHTGKRLVVRECNDCIWLPVGFETIIEEITEFEIRLTDTGSGIELSESDFKGYIFEFVNAPVKTKTLNLSERKRAAKAIRTIEKELHKLIREARDGGMRVDSSVEVRVSYQAPKERY